jgi:uncharacterized protein YlaI
MVEKCKKVYFADEKNALMYIEKIKKTSKRERNPINTYLCPKCLNWHLTSIEYKEDKQVIYLKRQVTNLQREVKNLKEKVSGLKQQNESLQERLMTEKKINMFL